ncbi:MAG TPA: RNA methyltransferase, partial [Cytophagales bacterium]
MVSGKWLKLVKSLQVKKYRQLHQAFLVEGAKSVLELMDSAYEIRAVFATEAFLRQHIRSRPGISFEYYAVTDDELSRLGSFQTNNAAVAIAEVLPNAPLRVEAGEYAVALDGIQDPGNVGTILRIADWYGITKVICSEDTADVYNPKVIAASMGSFTRVRTYYCDLPGYLRSHAGTPRLGAFLAGDDVHGFAFPPAGILVMGNESKGIRPDVEALITHKVHIPRYG